MATQAHVRDIGSPRISDIDDACGESADLGALVAAASSRCGHAPFTNPMLAEHPVRFGITSVSADPVAQRTIAAAEQGLFLESARRYSAV